VKAVALALAAVTLAVVNVTTAEFDPTLSATVAPVLPKDARLIEDVYAFGV